MTKQITLPQSGRIVTFEQDVDGAWFVQDVKGKTDRSVQSTGEQLMTDMELHSRREQLQEDIDRIVDDVLHEKLTAQETLNLVIALCDAVRKNFPLQNS